MTNDPNHPEPSEAASGPRRWSVVRDSIEADPLATGPHSFRTTHGSKVTIWYSLPLEGLGAPDLGAMGPPEAPEPDQVGPDGIGFMIGLGQWPQDGPERLALLEHDIPAWRRMIDSRDFDSPEEERGLLMSLLDDWYELFERKGEDRNLCPEYCSYRERYYQLERGLSPPPADQSGAAGQEPGRDGGG